MDKIRERNRSKIKDVDELAEIAKHARTSGRRIALAHGTFDLLHVGHIRHLESARGEGDMLIVTVTADAFVGRGPDRPVFNEHLRAEMLAALSCVDYIGINEAATAENVLATLQPDTYVKGPDYANPDDDITGNIVAERQAAEAYGGRVVFTDDITFSSSSLINSHLEVVDKAARIYLNGQRRNGLQGRIDNLFAKAADLRVLLIGDAIIDEYRYVHPLGMPPKDHIIAVHYRSQEVFAGGAAAAANSLASFCQSIDFLTCVGDDGWQDFIRNSLQPNVELNALVREGKPTTRKVRFIDQSYMGKLFEVYHFDDVPLTGDGEDRLVQSIEEKAPEYDLVVVTDFGHGMITQKCVDALQTHARFLAVNCQSNTANYGYNLITKYSRADYVCIDDPEARLAVHDKFADTETIVAESLPLAIDCPRIIVTHGKFGCVTWSEAEGTNKIPAFTNTVVDTTGAGDAFFAITSPLVAAGGSLADVGFVGNAAGALKVRIVGHRQSISKVNLLRYVRTLLK